MKLVKICNGTGQDIITMVIRNINFKETNRIVHEAWLDRWVFQFAHLRQLPSLAPYIPTSNPQLRDTVYEVRTLYHDQLKMILGY